MSASPAHDLNAAAFLVAAGNGADHETADDTYVSGAIVDRQSYGNPQSCIAIAGVAFTTASGMAGATQTITLAVDHDDDSAMASAATQDSDTFAYTWAADGANSGFHVLPVDLSSADRYIRCKVKMTEAGTATISANALTCGLLLGGMRDVPHANYAAAGHEDVTEAS